MRMFFYIRWLLYQIKTTSKIENRIQTFCAEMELSFLHSNSYNRQVLCIFSLVISRADGKCWKIMDITRSLKRDRYKPLMGPNEPLDEDFLFDNTYPSNTLASFVNMIFNVQITHITITTLYYLFQVSTNKCF